MSEAEFDLLLDLVRTEMEPDAQDLASLQTFFADVQPDMLIGVMEATSGIEPE
jgi:predicted secreted protein